MQYAYSWCGTRITFVLEESVAENYNAVVDKFFAAQKQHEEQDMFKWTPKLPIRMDLSEEQLFAFNKIGELINLLAELNGGSIDIPEEEVTSDYLIRPNLPPRRRPGAQA